MIGHTITDTIGRIGFVPWECEYCQLDSGGNHAFNCPYKTGVFPDHDNKITYSLAEATNAT